MKILLCFCACLAAAYAHGVISYPVPPFSYNTYVSPLTTVTRPLGVTYTGLHGYPLALAPSYFSLGVPNNVIYTGVPGVVHYFPIAPTGGKGKPDKKKPGEKNDEKDTKEETTEEPKKEEAAEPKNDEAEDLAE